MLVRCSARRGAGSLLSLAVRRNGARFGFGTELAALPHIVIKQTIGEP